ncbi:MULTISPECIES: histidine phosphatase family protein [unclassified Erysipelothrix]|nr:MULTISPECIES: histidine phosphatase family protein [unclassified Erysipelothrix]MBK2402201.1 histidine phosphatase family protein [Erysipelothrix sp. strain 2 (EsS2-6-Brazil)]MBK2404300.1 histidine phosphatase family protein [Erysipelothrix sp. strain 2 (EsS2-7-Brazil)]NBA01237.1 histidine phosphatase family protein [Erysipelothrix rhusiopathiae]
MKIVLVRHGYTTSNEEGTYSGWSDVHLSKQGIEDLKQYKLEYAYPQTERYYTSDLTRTIDTFEILYGKETPIYESSKELREIYFGDYEDVHGDDVSENYFDGFLINKRIAHGETLTEFSYRIISKLECILKDMKANSVESSTIVCHSGVIKTLLIFLENRPFLDFRAIHAPNGLGYILDVDFDDSLNRIILKSVEALPKK